MFLLKFRIYSVVNYYFCKMVKYMRYEGLAVVDSTVREDVLDGLKYFQHSMPNFPYK